MNESNPDQPQDNERSKRLFAEFLEYRSRHRSAEAEIIELDPRAITVFGAPGSRHPELGVPCVMLRLNQEESRLTPEEALRLMKEMDDFFSKSEGRAYSNEEI